MTLLRKVYDITVRKNPLFIFFLVLVTCWIIGDNYPFSDFPMYDEFPDHTYYIFVKNGDDEPIAFQETTGTRTAGFKKPYDKELNAIRKELKKRKRELTPAEREPAGRRALERLYANAGDEVKRRLEEIAPLRLYHADIYMTDKGVIDEREPVLVAELPLPPTNNDER